LQAFRRCRRRDSNPRHADYDLPGSPEMALLGGSKAKKSGLFASRSGPLGKSWENPVPPRNSLVASRPSRSYRHEPDERPTGHLQVKLDKNGRTRSFWVFWPERQARKGGRRLGPAHVRDSGRGTAR
jgi:hypothetical protein